IWLLHYSIPVLCLSFPKIRDSASALLEPPLKVFIQGASLEVFVVKKAGRTLAGFDWFHIRHYASTYRHFPDCYRRRGRMNVRWMVGMVMMMMTWIISGNINFFDDGAWVIRSETVPGITRNPVAIRAGIDQGRACNSCLRRCPAG